MSETCQDQHNTQHIWYDYRNHKLLPSMRRILITCTVTLELHQLRSDITFHMLVQLTLKSYWYIRTHCLWHYKCVLTRLLITKHKHSWHLVRLLTIMTQQWVKCTDVYCTHTSRYKVTIHVLAICAKTTCDVRILISIWRHRQNSCYMQLNACNYLDMNSETTTRYKAQHV